MYRAIQIDLKAWFNRQPISSRKPLILRGARQVGKSYCVRDFCHREGLQCLEINFERDPSLAQLFVEGPNSKTLALLGVHFKKELGSDTLLFLDEIQAAPKVFSRLRYFYEENPQVPVVAAGSLLEFSLNTLENSVPVGRLEYLYLGPMRFEEFLEAQNEERLLAEIRNWDPFARGKFPRALHEMANERVRIFSVVGGMPEVVQEFVRTGLYNRCGEIQRSILMTYSQDFAKYRRRIPLERLQRVLDAIPSQIGKKWIHARINPDERALPTQEALGALCLAQVAHRVQHSSGRALPLNAGANGKFFKCLFLDVGLTANQLGVDLTQIGPEHDLDGLAQGALAEQWVGQHLLDVRPLSQRPALFYWAREKKGAEAEVDYLLSVQNRIFPIEVKAGSSRRAKSLQVFLREVPNAPFGIHFSSAEPHWDPEQRVLGLPFYMVEQLPRLLLFNR